ncbi:MAG: OmpA family protein [Bacteroidetes bacterium]|nr:OmpA family protein [Bacteroidota bacterium]
MASKKYLLFSFILCLLVGSSFAQIGASYDLRDSSLIPAKRVPQHNEFLNNAYPFPAKPRNEWEIGVKGGLPFGETDVRYWGPTGGFGLHVRKAMGYVFSIRGEFDWLRMKGLNFQPSSGFVNNTAWTGQGYDPTKDHVFYNYRTTVNELSLQGVITLNNVRFHRAKTGFNAYGFGGIGLARYNTFINTHDASGNYAAKFDQLYAQYAGTSGQFDYSNRKAIKSALKSIMDGKFDTQAQEDNGHPKLGGWPVYPVMVVGAGVEFKLNNKFNIAVEYKHTFIKTDLLDGQQWQENYNPATSTSPAQTRDFDSYSFASVGINYNIGKKSVEPLWWLNPLDYAYSEINAPRHMKLPKPVLDDADGDGVTDQFDLEPNTPKGCPVDTHGVSRDTDGDGVPDCKDKELITPTQCQPVDADGVGKCPDPQCCKDLKAMMDNGNFGRKCSIGDLPSITFKGRSVTLSKDSKALMASIAQKMRNNPNCKVAVIGYGESSKAAQQLSWDRVNEVIKYLVEKEGVSADRFIFRYGQTGGDENTIDLKDGTGEEGPNTVPAPHPNLRRK